MSPREVANAIGESTPVRLGLVVVLLGLAGSAATTHYRMGEVEKKAAELAQKMETQREADITVHHAMDLRAQRAEDSTQRIVEGLARVETAIKEMQERGEVRTARGGR